MRRRDRSRAARSASNRVSVFVARTATGWGVIASRRFRKGQRIGRVTGFASKTAGDSVYLLDLGWGWSLDPTPPFRFLNHCCEPNCELVSEPPERRGEPPRLSVLALRTIEAGEEVRNDYAWPAEVSEPCRCGADGCRGWIVDEREVHLIPAPLRRRRRAAPTYARARERATRRRFRDEFFDEMAPSARRILYATPESARRWFWRSKRRYAHLPGIIPAGRAHELALLLDAMMQRHLHPWRIPIPRDSISGMTESYAESLSKTVRLETVFLNGVRSRAMNAAGRAGLTSLARSESFRAMAQALSGFRLEPGPDLQLHRYEAGDYVGPHNDHFPEGDPDVKGYIDVQLSLCSPAVESQYFIHEQGGYLSEAIEVGVPANLGVYWLPFWHMTTPLRARPDRRDDACRWVIVASFEISGRLPIPRPRS